MKLLILLIGFLIFLSKGKKFSILGLVSLIYFLFIPINFFIKLILFIIIYLFFVIYSMFKVKSSCEFCYYFGPPGAGKTTLASHIVKYSKVPCYCNVPILGSYKVLSSDYGVYQMCNGKLIIDESGIEFNNRDFKSNFSKKSLEWFKTHRHYNMSIYIFSQGHDDTDKKLRDLSTRYFMLSRSMIPFFVRSREILKYTCIDKLTKQIINGYKFKLFGSKYYFMPEYWKLFDSYEAPVLESKNWVLWGSTDRYKQSDDELCSSDC